MVRKIGGLDSWNLRELGHEYWVEGGLNCSAKGLFKDLGR